MDALSCPHCDRVFRGQAAILGKTIRCRGCRGVFRVPRDPLTVPQARPGFADGTGAAANQPMAIADVVAGKAVRSCPACGRTFTMQPKFARRSIRCRGCRTPFHVPAETEPARSGLVASAVGDRAGAAPGNRPPQPGSMTRRPPPLPTADAGSDDAGDIVDDPPPGETVPSVVRPAVSGAATHGVVELIAVIVGGVCAFPVTQLILWWGFHKDPLQIAERLPPDLRWIAPEHLDGKK